MVRDLDARLDAERDGKVADVVILLHLEDDGRAALRPRRQVRVVEEDVIMAAAGRDKDFLVRALLVILADGGRERDHVADAALVDVEAHSTPR